ncbi:MAG: hypothetical protein ACLFRR_10450 [Spirochaetaceae bacterium]
MRSSRAGTEGRLLRTRARPPRRPALRPALSRPAGRRPPAGPGSRREHSGRDVAIAAVADDDYDHRIGDAAGAGTIVDLGANEGLYTLLSKLHGSAARIIAVESLAENVAVLRHNLAANRIEGVEVIRAAVRGSQFERTEMTTLETYPHVGTVASTETQQFRSGYRRHPQPRFPANGAGEGLRP